MNEEPTTEYVAIRYRRSTVNPMMAVANDGHAARTFGPDEIAPWRTAAQLQAADEVVAAARQRIGGSHAMGCAAYGTVTPGPCDCGREAMRAALARLDRANKETQRG